MENIEEALLELNFTKYESKALITLIKYHSLSASDIYKYSGVPQPKIYDTMLKLQTKGFVDVFPQDKHKIYRIKPKHIVQARIQEYISKIRNIGSQIKNEIEDIYESEETSDIPFVGIAGENSIQENVYMLIETAKSSFSAYFNENYFNEKTIQLINEMDENIEINLVFHNMNKITELQPKIAKASFYYLEYPGYETFPKIIEMIENFLPKDQKSSYSFDLIKKMSYRIKDLFSIAVVDKKTSLFTIPLPVNIPISILSTLPDIVEFHSDGMDAIIKAAKKI